jgi:hypothetical protein
MSRILWSVNPWEQAKEEGHIWPDDTEAHNRKTDQRGGYNRPKPTRRKDRWSVDPKVKKQADEEDAGS